MIQVQLYIVNNENVYQKVDLYENESIELVDSIQNLRDPARFFSEFTKSFSVPASPRNNGIFKHFYEANISNGFDARIRVDAEIRIDGIPYKEGQVKLEMVTMKNGEADSYSLIFYGATMKIKQEIFDAKLASLDLSFFDHPYTGDNVEAGFRIGLTNPTPSAWATDGSNVAATPADADIVYPFISVETQYVLDSTSTPKIHPIGDNTTGIKFRDLKPAIRAYAIIEAIENDLLAEFGSSFDKTGFFAETTFTEQIWLWLHSQKGGIIGEGEYNSVFYFKDRTYNAASPSTENMAPDGFFRINDLRAGFTFEFTFTITGTGDWDVLIYNEYTGDLLYEERNLTGTQTITVSYARTSSARTNIVRPQAIVKTPGTITAIDLQVKATEVLVTTLFGAADVSVYDFPAISPVDYFSTALNLPDMKIIDFLTSIFKMYNLTIQRRGSVYYIETLNDFYAGGATRDITTYVDDSSVEILPSSPYDTITFAFEEAGSYLLDKRRELVEDEDYGNEKYDLGNVFEDNEYEVKVGFEKILFERMTDISDDSITTNMWSWCADGSENPYIGKPILFHYDVQIPSNPLTVSPAWDHDATLTSARQAMCSNTVNDGADWPLTFGDELGEYTQQPLIGGNLFTNYWADYIQGVYNVSSRIVRVKAWLPQSFITSYSLADTIIYKNKEYFINEMSINLTTGEADIELVTKWL